MTKVKLCDFLSLMVDNYQKIIVSVFDDNTIIKRYEFPEHTIDFTEIPDKIWESNIYSWAVYHDVIAIAIKKG